MSIRQKLSHTKNIVRIIGIPSTTAADAAFKHECIDEKQLPKARRPITAADRAELKRLTEMHEDEFEELDPEYQVEMSDECERCDAPKFDKDVQTEAEPEIEPEAKPEMTD